MKIRRELAIKGLSRLVTPMVFVLAAVTSSAHIQDEEPFWSKGRPKREAAEKMKAMRSAGIHVVKSPADMGAMVAKVLGRKK